MRAFEYVAKGEELYRAGQPSQAEKSFQKAIQAYERENDLDGLGYALGRLGYYYEEVGDSENALATYRRAAQLGADIPAIFSSLIGLLVSRGEIDEAFRMADQWQQQGAQHLRGPAHAIFIGLGGRLVREQRYEQAISVLSRAITALVNRPLPPEYWEARGELGQAYEKAGSLDLAMREYAAAISDGSTNRATYTRYLINLERQGQCDEALRTINVALSMQHDAAWEADLRKRLQRLGRKTGSAPRDSSPAIIPAFSVRRGQEIVSLYRQVKLSPGVANLAVTQEMIYVTTGGKTPKLLAFKLPEVTEVWQIEIPEPATDITATASGIVILTQHGRIGEGETTIRFLDLAGQEQCVQRLPDAPSEVAGTSDRLFIGCRDGKLYTFSVEGRLLWSFQVPGSGQASESPYMHPCPYCVQAGLDLVAFSSFENVFVADRQGTLLWKWTVPSHEETMQAGPVTISLSTGATPVRAIAVPVDGRKVGITAGDTFYELAEGTEMRRSRRKERMLGSISVSPSGDIWAYVAGEQVLLYSEGKSRGSFAVPGNASLTLNATADRLAAWVGKQLVIATLRGKIVGEVEFVKNISGVHCLDNGRVAVGAGQLVILDTAGQSGASISKPEESLKKKTESSQQTELLPEQSEERGVWVRWIDGEKLSAGAAKAAYRSARGQPVTIEQLALEHYERLGYTGIWSENDYWWKIMALLFWDVIFAQIHGVFSPLLGSFPGRGQDMPNDFFSPDFYPRRKELVSRRIAALTQPRLFGLQKPNIEAELRGAFRKYQGTPCRPINWERFTADELAMAIKVLTNDQLMAIMLRLLENFSENRSGLPDLFLVQAGKPLFVEVKSAREQVAEHQFGWMEYLRSTVGVEAEICRVRAT